MATAQDDGLDQIRRDLVDLVLREAGGRVAADPKSPVAQLLSGIVRREMAAAVEELRHGGAVIDAEVLAEALARRLGAAPVGAGEYRSGSVASSPNRIREISFGCVAAVLAVAIFVGGYALGGGLNRSSSAAAVAAPSAAPSAAPADPALVLAPAAGATGGATGGATAPAAAADGATGIATQLRERPR